MDACATYRPTLPGDMARRRPPCSGFTTLETIVTLAIAGVLSLVGLAATDLQGGLDLAMAQQELRGCLDQAFVLARAQGRNVTLVPAGEGGGPGIIPVQLPRRVKWGKPASIPLPPGMDAPKTADRVGEAHHRLTVTPRRTVNATAWFMNNGTDALCFRLNGHGRLQVLHYRAARHRWERMG